MTTPVFTVVIDGNPGALAINNAKKAVVIKGNARLVDTGPAKKAKAAAREAVFRAAMDQPELANAVQDAAHLIVEVDSYWAEQRHLPRSIGLAKGDVDGPLKLTIDALEGAKLIDDDARIVLVTARKFIDRDRPRIELRVMPAPLQTEDDDGQQRLV